MAGSGPQSYGAVLHKHVRGGRRASIAAARGGGYRVDNIARTRSAIRAPLVPGGKKPAKLPSASNTYVKEVWSIEY